MSFVCQQAAVIPYRIARKGLEIALVTSARGRRWIVPKGSVEVGERTWQAAVRETLEEAGLVGVVRREPLGSYEYRKRGVRFRVDVFLMRVSTVLDEWPEDDVRERCWMTLDEAQAHVEVPIRRFLGLLDSHQPAQSATQPRHSLGAAAQGEAS
jgi:8-oxo-dGTP pyrophosphatase MutT (NUDIX family)